MPQRENLHFTSANPVVQVISDTCQMQTSYAVHACAQNRSTDARLSSQKQESLRDVIVEGLRCKVTVFVPPPRSRFNLRLRSPRDADVHDALAMAASQSREHVISRDGFAPLSLGDGHEQFRLLLGCQVKARLIVFGKNRHRRAFCQGHAVKNYLPAYHLSGRHLHGAKDTPIRIRLGPGPNA